MTVCRTAQTLVPVTPHAAAGGTPHIPGDDTAFNSELINIKVLSTRVRMQLIPLVTLYHFVVYFHTLYFAN